jgi:hypothetical protein
MAQFRLESRMSFRSRHLRIESRVRIHWTARRRREAVPAVDIAAELAGYTTEAELNDIAAMLDRYPDEDTEEIRSILAGQAHGRLGTR